jgi:heat shock protein HtpX
VYFYGDIFIVRQFSGQDVEGHDPYGLTVMLKKLSRRAGMSVPWIRILPNPSLIAFSVGRNTKNSCIFVSQGLVDRLDKEEVEAVLAYELASIATHNTLASTIASGLMNGLMIIPNIIDQGISWALSIKWEAQRRGQFTVWFVVPLCLVILKLCIKESTPGEIDAVASEWLESKDLLAKTLWKLDSYSNTLPYRAPAALAHLFMVNPLTKKGWTRYFVHRMSTEHRIKKLLGYYPI